MTYTDFKKKQISAWYEGYAAYFSGKFADDCPNIVNTQIRETWIRGWYEGELDDHSEFV